MGKIDKEREEISWIKFWIGVAVAAIMGLVSWFVNHYATADKTLLILDVVSIFVAAVLVIILNKTGLKKIKKLEDL